MNPDIKISQYIHETWGLKEGLPQITVYDVIQTHDGYIWVGTQEGVGRFDGVTFTRFNKSNTSELSNQRIQTLHEDRNGILWIGTYGGGVTCLRDGVFTNDSEKYDLAEAKIRTIYEDKRGDIWIGTGRDGLLRFKGGAPPGVTGLTPPGVTGLSRNSVNTICRDSAGNLWVGTNSGLNRLKGSEIKRYTMENGLAHNLVMSVIEDSKGRLWIGTKGGLNCMNGGECETYTREHGLKGNYINALLEDRDKNLWIGTDKGVHRLKRGNNSNFRENCTAILETNSIQALLEDREGSLWIGSWGGGLHRLREGRFTTYARTEGLAHDKVNCIIPGRDNSLWIGTQGGLNHIRRNGLSTDRDELLLPGIVIKSLCRDRLGNLWIGTLGALKFLENPVALQPHHMRREAGKPTSSDIWTSDFAIYSIYEDREHNLWVGASKGLKRFRKGKPVPFSGSETFSKKWVSAILQDREGSLWVATREGLHCLKENGIIPSGVTGIPPGVTGLTIYTKKEGLCSNNVYSLYEDSEGTLWIGTNSGLNRRTREGKITGVTSLNGLFNDSIFQVLEAGAYFWFSCNNGIFRVKRQELEDCLNGKIETLQCQSYNEADGMKSRNCVWANQPSGCKSSDGKLWFTTFVGAVEIEPEKLKCNNEPPPVKIEGLIVDKKRLPIKNGTGGNNLIIPPGINRLEIRYTALSYQVPERVRFQTILEGYDQKWSAIIKKRSVDYTNLNPGQYTFRVKACNNDGIWNETGAYLSFYIKPTFIQTPWFYLLCAALLSMLLFLAYRYRIRKIKKIEIKLRAMVDERTAELNERNLELLTLEQAIREINREMKMDNVLSALLEKAMKLLPRARAGAFLIYDPLSGKYDLHAYRNIDPKQAEKMSFFRDTGLEFLKECEKELGQDIYFFPDFARLYRESKNKIWIPFHSALAVVARVDNNPRGLLILATHDTPITIGKWDIHKLNLFREHTIYALMRARTLQDLAEMVEERTVELKNKITELTRAQEALKKAGERAERADMVKTRFLTNISHEIRTPMNAIMGFSELLESEIEDKRQNDYLKAIKAGGQTLLSLINDILDLSKIEAGKIQLCYEPVNPVTILEETKHMFQQEALGRKLTLEVVPTGDLPELLEMDRARVRQILFNLVGNAVKFTHEGTVTLSVNRVAEIKTVVPGDGAPGDGPGTESVDIAYTVRDTGIGIPPEQHETIFEVFRQQDGLKSDTYGGTGLGLGICRRLTGLMQGTITVESEVNKGSIFTLTLPGLHVAGPVYSKSGFKQLHMKENPDGDTLVLVVDDVEMNRGVLAECLKYSGIKTVEAENGREAVRLAARHNPDLIFMDLRMPVMNGIEAAEAIKADPKTAHIPVVALTAYITEKEELTRRTDIFSGCLFKPISPQEIDDITCKFIPTLNNNNEDENMNRQTAAEKSELIKMLGTTVSKQWKKVSETYLLHDIKEFAENTLALAIRLHSPLLESWARQLKAEIDAFDMQKTSLTLERFPQIVEEIKEIIGETHLP
ncbi:MAG: response regulator [bacterium]|nr:response regulator [bacterium]